MIGPTDLLHPSPVPHFKFLMHRNYHVSSNDRMVGESIDYLGRDFLKIILEEILRR